MYTIKRTRRTAYLCKVFVQEIMAFVFEGEVDCFHLLIMLDSKLDHTRLGERSSAEIMIRWMRCTGGMCAKTHFVIPR